MLKSCVVIETVVASRPSAAIAAKISHSLPKPHEPMRLPSKSAGDVMPSPLYDTWSVPDLWYTCAMSVSSAPVASRVPSTFGTHAIGEVDVARDEGVLRHDVAAGGDDLDVVEALFLEVALLLRDVVAGELRLRQPLQLQLDRRDRLEVAAVAAWSGAGDEHAASARAATAAAAAERGRA